MAVDLKQIADDVINTTLTSVDTVAGELATEWFNKNARTVRKYEDRMYTELVNVMATSIKERKLSEMNAAPAGLRAITRLIRDYKIGVEPAEFAVMAYMAAKQVMDNKVVDTTETYTFGAPQQLAQFHPYPPAPPPQPAANHVVQAQAAGRVDLAAIEARVVAAPEYHWQAVGVEWGRVAHAPDDHANDAAQQQRNGRYRRELEAMAEWSRVVRRPGDAD